MPTSVLHTCNIAILSSFFAGSLGEDKPVLTNATERYAEAFSLASDALMQFVDVFQACVATTMPSRHFLMDDIQSYLFYPAKTTVGFAAKYTSNRKFFANLVGTTAFQKMVIKDVRELQSDYVSKLKFCDETAMEQDLLREMYDREFEEHKL